MLALLSLVSLPSAAPAGLNELARESTVIADRQSKLEVYLPHDVDLTNPRFGVSDFKIKSEARFAGFALVSRENGESWMGGRIREGRGEIYFFVSVDSLLGTQANEPSFPIPAGRYDLYMLADSQVRTVLKLNLDELGGRTTLRPSAAVHSMVKFPTALSLDPSANVHWFETSGRLKASDGIQFGATWFKTRSHVVTSSEACFYKGPRVPEPDRSLPACFAANAADRHENNTGLTISTYPSVELEKGVQFVPAARVYTSADGWGSGRFSQALSVRTGAVTGKVGAIGIWLTL